MKNQRVQILLLVAVPCIIFAFSVFRSLKMPDHQGNPANIKIENKKRTVPGDWITYQRCYPYNSVKLSSYLSGIRQAEALHNKPPEKRYSWESAGPDNIGGRITDIEIHLNSPSTIYVAAATGGILKTTDNGQSWQNIFSQASVITVGDITIDPNNENIIYAGTGEANSSSFSFPGNGIYKSVNGGVDWQYLGLEYSGYIARIIADHSNSDRIFVAVCGSLFSPNPDRGIYRSINGGISWERILFVTDSTSAIDIVQHPTDPDILYAAMWERIRGLNTRRSYGESSGIYKTTDGGDTWVEMTNGLTTGDDVGRIGLAIAKSNPNVVYAFYDNEDKEKVFKTTNGGTTWNQTNDSDIDGMNSSFGWYFGQIRVDPSNENRVYVLGVELYRSDNGGNSWICLANYNNTYEIHVDHHSLYINENTGRITEGNDGGLYISDNYGDDWTKINNLPITQIYALDIDYSNPERIYCGTQDNNTIRTMTGALDDWEPILGGDGFYCLVDYNNSNIIYAESQYGNLRKSVNGGNNFGNILNSNMEQDRKNWSSPLAMHPQDPEILYFGTYRVWKTTNGGNNWTAVSNDLTQDIGSGYSTLSTIAISSLDPNIVIAGSDDSRVHISTNGGNTWEDISDGLPERWITRVAADPFDSNIIYATVSGFRWDEPLPHVFKSSDQGQTWNNISSNLPELPVNCMVPDPEIQNRLFVGSDAGIFCTEDGGQSWWSLTEGIPNVPVFDMKIHNPTRTLVIGTHGCSAYKLDIDNITNIESLAVKVSGSGYLHNYPNPFYSETHILFTLVKNSHISLTIYNSSGQIVKTLKQGSLTKGTHTIKWYGNDDRGQALPVGIYFVQLQTNETALNRRIVLMK